MGVRVKIKLADPLIPSVADASFTTNPFGKEKTFLELPKYPMSRFLFNTPILPLGISAQPSSILKKPTINMPANTKFRIIEIDRMVFFILLTMAKNKVFLH